MSQHNYNNKGLDVLPHFPANTTVIYASNNKIQIIPEWIFSLSKLQQLQLINNQLKTIPSSISKLKNLTHLYLSQNQITELPEEIGELVNLQVLDLRNNLFEQLPQSIVKLTKLTQIFLAGNKLPLPLNYKDGQTPPATIIQHILNSQTTLNLNNKGLDTLPIIPKGIIALQGAGNKFKVIPQQLFEIISLQQLQLQKNQIVIIPPSIGNLQKLIHLYLFNNVIEKLPDEIGKLTQLQALRLEHNKLVELTEAIGKLANLAQLYLSNNQLQKLPKGISQLSKLSNLVLNNNPLGKIPDFLCSLPNLTSLSLLGCELTELPDKIGNLLKLVTLDLRGNYLERLPESIDQLKTLENIYLSGNNLLLPEGYKDSSGNAQEIIRYVLDNQPPPPPSIKTDKIYIYRNISDEKLFQEEYKDNINNYLIDKYDLDIKEINEPKDIDVNSTIVFILLPYDTPKNAKLVFDIIKTCEAKERAYYILTPLEESISVSLVNLEQGKIIKTTHQKIQNGYKENIYSYKSLEDLSTIVISALQNYSPKVILKELHLRNIGHFENEIIHFDKQMTCIVGENGTGKTTLLRALALCIIGTDNNELDKEKIANMLSVLGYDYEELKRAESGSIELIYDIDSEEYSQLVKLEVINQKVELETVYTTPILFNEFDLKTLIIGFPQIRTENDFGNGNLFRSRTHANIRDLIYLIHNEEDQRLESFNSWIVNLYGRGNDRMLKNNKLKKNDVEEFQLIDNIFEIISDLTNHDGKERYKLTFKTVYRYSPPSIIVSTFDAPEGIPLELTSQGFRTLIGWIGFFLQRLSEANPLKKSRFNEEKAIVIIDEIDSYIHPVWQSIFINKLQKNFPKTQFIVSTHSPLMVAGLDREQIIELEFDNKENKVVARENQVDTWAMGYRDILMKLFNTPEPRPTKTLEELEWKLEQDIDEEERERIKDAILRLKESAAFEDDLEKYRQSLEEREKELDKLREKLKEKLAKLR